MRGEGFFENLAESIMLLHQAASDNTKSAINKNLTLRNWFIGGIIVEYEQNGKDRAEYGSNLLKNLEQRINQKGMNVTLFKNCRRFYQMYPQVGNLFIESGAPPAYLIDGKSPMLSDFLDRHEMIRPTPSDKYDLPPRTLVENLSFSHIVEIMTVDEKIGRLFYEVESIKCKWSVKELRRQIDSKLYIRAGISKKPELLLEKTEKSESVPVLEIRQPYVFEFLGLDANKTVSESDLEQAIMDHLQEFLLEMGKGFCFEARQKRIIIDDEYYFIDLVLYNRILHCNVIIELKMGKFRIEHAAQLNTYVSYYKFEEMTAGDNPPIGILLCTEQGPKMVQYVLNGMDENLFASTYQLQLPDKKQLEDFLIKEMKAWGR